MNPKMSDTDIRLKFQSIEDTLLRQDDSLKRIETVGKDTNNQAKDTNGKVAAIVAWRERTTGAMWAFGCCLVLIIIPIAGWTLYNQVTEGERIQTAVSSYFTENYSSIQVNHGQ